MTPAHTSLASLAPTRERRTRLAIGLMAASGFASLGYQIVWTRQCALWLGHESAAVLAVVAAFFGGIGLGALALGGRIERSAQPARWYAGCEAMIGVWGAALVLLMPPASGALLALTGAQPTPAWQWTVAFSGSLLLLLPATAAMGATLPAMARVLAHRQHPGGAIAALYAANTAGAVIGVLATAFWLVPAFGLVRSSAVCVLLNGLCAALAWRLGRDVPPSAPSALPASAAPGLAWRLAATGLLGIGYEVLVVRVLSQVAEDTVYTFALLLAVYLVGTAAGAAAYQRVRAARRLPAALGNALLLTLAAACAVGAASLWAAEALKGAVLQALGAGMPAALAAEAMLALAAFGLPTLVMGALFSHLAQQAGAAGLGLGRALAINTLGATAAPLLFGVLLLPLLGPQGALALLVAGYIGLMSWPTLRRPAARAGAAAALAAALAALVWAPPLRFIDIPEGGRLVSYQEGAMAAVSVVEDADGVARLRIDNRQQEGSSATLLADARQALLPMLLHPAPRRALFLGLGTGMTASSAADEAQLQVDAVELLPEVIAASAHFTQALNGGAVQPRLHLVAADARRYVRAAGPAYDLVVSDNFHPARSGSGALYTVEHFRAVKARLAGDGLFCQWLPLHQLDLDTLRSIVQAYLAVYPGAHALLATHSLDTPVLGLVARADGGRFDAARLRQRLATVALSQPSAAFGLADEMALLGSFVAGPRGLRQFAGDAALNTDDRPVVAYAAPRITYAPDTLPRDRLVALLHELPLAPDELLMPADAAALGPRLAAYWAARGRFIELGRTVQPVADVHRMLAQVQAPLLAVLRTSPDFRPAYDPLLRMADALSRSDPAAGRALLAELAQIQPARPEAVQALARIGSP